MSKTQKITYLYRDAGNYKFWGEFCVTGNLSLAELGPYLLDGEYFVPERIGIPSLVPDIKNDDDHMLHEIDSIESTEPSACLFSAKELVARFRAANHIGWFCHIGWF